MITLLLSLSVSAFALDVPVPDFSSSGVDCSAINDLGEALRAPPLEEGEAAKPGLPGEIAALSDSERDELSGKVMAASMGCSTMEGMNYPNTYYCRGIRWKPALLLCSAYQAPFTVDGNNSCNGGDQAWTTACKEGQRLAQAHHQKMFVKWMNDGVRKDRPQCGGNPATEMHEAFCGAHKGRNGDCSNVAFDPKLLMACKSMASKDVDLCSRSLDAVTWLGLDQKEATAICTAWTE